MLIWMLSALFLLFILLSTFYSDLKGAPFVPNNISVIQNSLTLAKLDHNDIFMDLGSGNGKALFYALKTFNVKKAIGYEISPWPYLLSVVKTKKLPVKIKHKIQIYRRSIFDANLQEPTVVYLYLFPKLLEKLSPMLIKAKKNNPKLRIVSAVFSIKGMKPVKNIFAYHNQFKKKVKIFLY